MTLDELDRRLAQLEERVGEAEALLRELCDHQHRVGDPTGRRSHLPITRPVIERTAR